MPPESIAPTATQSQYFTEGMLRAISSSLGGDAVAWLRLDTTHHQVTLVSMVEAVAEAQMIADQHLGTTSSSLDTVFESIWRSGECVSVRASELESNGASFLGPLAAVLQAFPVDTLTGVTVALDNNALGILIVCRRGPDVHTVDERRRVVDGARRITGQPLRDTNPNSVRASSYVRTNLLRKPKRFVLQVLVGVVPPVLVTAAIAQAYEPVDYRPGALLILCCVVAAFVAGTEAALAAALTSTFAVWWALSMPQYSFRITDDTEVTGLAIFVVSMSVVIALVRQLQTAKRSEFFVRSVNRTLLDNSPISMAVFDTGLCFTRVNAAMAAMNGASIKEHRGKRPSDLSPMHGQLYEHLLAKVLAEGIAVVDHPLTLEIPELSLERHWIATYQPLRDSNDDLVGIGAIVLDVTEEFIAQRRAACLLELSEAASTAIDIDHVAPALCQFLVSTFRGRAVFVVENDDTLAVVGASGFTPETRPSTDERFGINPTTPLGEAARTRAPVIVTSEVERASRFAGGIVATFLNHEVCSVSIPVFNDAGVRHLAGVFHVGWTNERRISSENIAILETVGALVSLALTRIAISESAHQDDFRRALNAMLDSVQIASAIRNESGQIVDFEIVFVNQHSVEASSFTKADTVHRHLRELYNETESLGFFDRLCDVVETGIPYQADRVRYVGTGPAGSPLIGYWDVQVVKFNDGYLASTRDVTDLVATEEAARAAALQAENERVTVELLQTAALPASLPTLAGVGIAAVYEPADIHQPVGGDWYDAFMLPDGRLALVIADVAGHGSAAAGFMVQVRNVFRALAIEHSEPGRVLHRANEVTCTLNDVGGPFVTCCYAVLDVASGLFEWAQAGHFSPMRVSATGEVTYFDTRAGVPLALFPDQSYQSHTVQLNGGDRVLLFTDGLVERRDEIIDIGLARLATLVSSLAVEPPSAFVETAAALVVDRFDDLAVVCIAV